MRPSPLMVFLCASLLLVCAEAGNRKIIRTTRYGRVRGTRTERAQVFLGIPFAAPAKRWTAPVKPDRWKGILDARTPKPMCHQAGSCSQDTPIDCIPLKSEDCLYLNIFAPLTTKKSSGKAVLFFMHGGRFESGTGAGLIYNAEEVARKGDIIVVTINYRLGAFGFLSTGSSAGDITGNYGLKDQRRALKWVNGNIKRFGGDKNRITIAGQSAGAYSVGIHLTSGKADNLFNHAIIQSSPSTIPVKTMAAAREQALGFASKANCSINLSINIDCLRALSADEIVELQGAPESTTFSDSALRSFLPWLPHIDGVEVKTGLLEALNSNSLSPKPLMLGAVKDEGLPYIRSAFVDPVPFDLAVSVIQTFVPNAPTELLGLYPVTDVSDYREEFAAMTTDYVFSCPNLHISRNQSSRMPVYTYDFRQPLNFPEAVPTEPYCVGRVCHGFDLPFVFQSARIEPYVFNQEELALSNKMIAYWASFVKNGNPNKGVKSTKWQRYDLNGMRKESTIVLEGGSPGVRIVQGLKTQFCDVWDTTGYQ